MPFRPLFPVAALGLAAALLTVAGGCNRGASPKNPDDGPLVVTVAHPLVDTVTLFTDLTGTVQAKEVVNLRPRVSGYITEVKFKEGEEVKKDQPLFVIDPTIYKAQVNQAEGDVKNYEAQLKKAEADLTRTREAFEKGAAAKSELDVSAAGKGVAAAQLFTANASLEQARQNLTWTTVVAPIAGRVDSVYQTVGNLVTGTTTATGGTGTVLTNIVSTDPMYAYFDVDEQTVLNYMRLIKEGKIKSVREGAMVDARIQLRGETGYPHQGYLDFVSNRLDPGTGSLTIRGVFPNPDRFLVPGLFCRAQIPATQPFEAILIPPTAVVNDQGRRSVYVVGADNRVELRQVELGQMHNGLQIVPDGVTPGEGGRRKGITRTDRVVIRGVQRLEPGMPVEPRDGTITYPPEPPPPPGMVTGPSGPGGQQPAKGSQAPPNSPAGKK